MNLGALGQSEILPQIDRIDIVVAIGQGRLEKSAEGIGRDIAADIGVAIERKANAGDPLARVFVQQATADGAAAPGDQRGLVGFAGREVEFLAARGQHRASVDTLRLV